jgi:hypothetical protein
MLDSDYSPFQVALLFDTASSAETQIHPDMDSCDPVLIKRNHDQRRALDFL